MSNHYEEIADTINNCYVAAKKDAVTFTTRWLHDLYTTTTGGSNYPRTEARNHIASALAEKYQLIISYGDNAVCIHPDRNFSPG